jgi:predicted  nucleic acid-binding Zn-ribbon protein
MKNTIKPRFSKPQLVAASTTGLFLIAIFALFSLNKSNHSLQDLLNKNSLQSEKTLSEKLQLEKEIAKMQKEYDFLEGRNTQTDVLIRDLKLKLTQKESAIKSIANDKSASAKYKKELESLKQMRAQLEAEITKLNGSIANLKSENQRLTGTIASLEAKNKEMSDRNALLSTIAATNFRIDATKGKSDKITVLARQTKKLTLGFDVPESDVETVQFTIHTPSGKSVKQGKNLAVNIASDNTENLYASVNMFPDITDKKKRLEMIYKPDQKMEKGIYTIDISNKDIYLGSCQVKLR